MKLEDAKSKEEVAKAIADGDQEMIDSIDAFLEEARDSFLNSDDHYGEEQDLFEDGIHNIVDGNDAFLDMVIRESASTGFDLSRVPRESVADSINYTCRGESDRGERFSHWGPFAISYPNDRYSRLEWSYDLKGSKYVRFDEGHFPDAELAALIPEDKAKAFWNDLATELSSWEAKRAKTTDFEWMEQTGSLGEKYGYGVGEDYAIGSFNEEKFTEWCRDIVSEHVNKLVSKDPKAAYEMFLSSAKLANGIKALLQKGQEAEGENWPPEEVMDFVVQFFEQEDESAREEVLQELDKHLIKTYDPESLVPDFLAAVEEHYSLPSVQRVNPNGLKDWNDARAEGFFTEEDIQALAEDWLDKGRQFGGYGYSSGLAAEIDNELTRYRFEKDPGPAVEKFVNEVTEALKKTSVGDAGANVVRKAIEEKHFSKKNVLEMAFKWSNKQKQSTINELEDYADAIMKGEQIPEQDTVATISKADIAKLGITSGYLAEEGPFKLIKLRPQDLAAEGRRMRHCVGDSPHYARGVADGSKEIWSLRDRNNKPHFTLEIDTGIHRYKPDPAEVDDETSDSHKWAKQRAQFVRQLKGKANRTPGFAEPRSGSVTKLEEVIFWKWLLKKLHINPDQVRDFSAAKMDLPTKVAASLRVYRPSTQRLSARLDNLADGLRGWMPRALVAAVDDAAFLLAE